MDFLVWFDDNAKHSIADKIAGGRQAYEARFQTAPAVVLMSEDEREVEVPGITVLFKSWIHRNNYWFGMSDA